MSKGFNFGTGEKPETVDRWMDRIEDRLAGTSTQVSAKASAVHTHSVTEVTEIGQSGLAWQVIDADANASGGSGYAMDASSNTVTLTLPEDPTASDAVGIKALDITNTVTVDGNGHLIEGYSTLEVDIDISGFTLVYMGSDGWSIVSEVGAHAPPHIHTADEIGAHTHVLTDVTDAGTIASQDADAVAITGGSVDGVTLTNMTFTGGTTIDHLYAGTIEFKDEDCTDNDTNAMIYANATDTGSGTEDIDVYYEAQRNGSLYRYMWFDASAGTMHLDSPNWTQIDGKLQAENYDHAFYGALRVYDNTSGNGGQLGWPLINMQQNGSSTAWQGNHVQMERSRPGSSSCLSSDTIWWIQSKVYESGSYRNAGDVFCDVDTADAANTTVKYRFTVGQAGHTSNLDDVLEIAAGGIIANGAQNDCDFTIKKHTSGNAYFYDAGAGTHNISGQTSIDARLQVTGNTPPSSGDGIEFGHNGTAGIINAYDRDLSSWSEMDIDGSSVVINSVSGGSLDVHGDAGFIDSDNTASWVDQIELKRGDGTGNAVSIRSFGDASNGASGIGLGVNGSTILSLDANVAYMAPSKQFWVDVIKERSSGAGVTIDGVLLKDNDVHAAAVFAEDSVAALTAYRGSVTGESYPRWDIDLGGTMKWGSGSGGTDTNLYRSAANELKTDGTFVCSDYLVNYG